MDIKPEDLQESQRQIYEAKARLATQAKLVEQLTNAGKDTTQARKVLETMRATLVAMEGHDQTQQS